MRISPGMLLASRDEVLEVKAGDPVLQQRLLLHGGGGDDASSSRRSQTHTNPKTQAEAGAGLGSEAGLEVGRMVMGRGSTVKCKCSFCCSFTLYVFAHTAHDMKSVANSKKCHANVYFLSLENI